MHQWVLPVHIKRFQFLGSAMFGESREMVVACAKNLAGTQDIQQYLLAHSRRMLELDDRENDYGIRTFKEKETSF